MIEALGRALQLDDDGVAHLGYEKLPIADADRLTLVLYHAEPHSKSAQALAPLAGAAAEDPMPAR